MSESMHEQRRSSSQDASTEVEPSESTRAEELRDELDDLLDEIDEVLETNAEEFVRSYVQKGGE